MKNSRAHASFPATSVLHSELRIPNSAFRRFAVTLVELLVVVALLGLAAGLLSLRLDGITQTGRLRAAARQLAHLIELSRVDAVTGSRPVVLRYPLNQGTITRLRPVARGDEIRWQQSAGIDLPAGVTIATVVRDTERSHSDRETIDVRVTTDGDLEAHQVRLALPSGQTIQVLVDGVSGATQIVEPASNEDD